MFNTANSKNLSRVSMLDTFFQDNGYFPKLYNYTLSVQTLTDYPKETKEVEHLPNPLASYLVFASDNLLGGQQDLVYIQKDNEFLVNNTTVLVEMANKLVNIVDTENVLGDTFVEIAVSEWVHDVLSLSNGRLTKDASTGNLVVKSRSKKATASDVLALYDKAMGLIERFYGNQYIDVEPKASIEPTEAHNGKRVIAKMVDTENLVYGVLLYGNEGSTVLLDNRAIVGVTEIYLLD